MGRFAAWHRGRDFLGEVQVFVAVALIGTLLIMIFKGWDAIAGDSVITGLPLRVDEPVAGLAEGVTVIAGADELTVEISRPTLSQRVLAALIELPAMALIVAAMALLSWIIYHARRTNPFTARTVTGLRVMGLVLFAGIVVAGVDVWAQFLLSDSITGTYARGAYTIPIAWLVGGFLCFAAAEVVQRGRLMREELATVV